MSVNRYQPHVVIIPEDRADEQIANGFTKHDQVTLKQVQVMPYADGWPGVLNKFTTKYISYLRSYKDAYIVLLIDFDTKYESQRRRFDDAVPDNLKDRVFVVGVKEDPERLAQVMGKSLEEIGLDLADDCYKGTDVVWSHDHLKHNEPDLAKMIQSIKSILFPK